MSRPATPEDVEEEGPFVTIPHFGGHCAVLVQPSRLGEISRDELAAVIADAWRACAPKRLVEEPLGPRGSDRSAD